MPTFRLDCPWTWYVLWNAIAFAGALVVNSFIEHLAHRFVLHGTRFGRFAYEKHDRQHHVIFDGGVNYHAHNEFMRSHVTFTAVDYVLFLAATTPLWMGAEMLVGRPFLIGGVLATLFGLQAFNSLHWRFHCPSDTWFQRTRFFLFLKAHHRAHHSDTTKNFNVYCWPLADVVMGTLKRD